MASANNGSNEFARPTHPGTFDFQESLPRVPLPELSDTCGRFLEWCRPLLTDAQYRETEASLTHFARPDGPAEALDQDLRRYRDDPQNASWLDDFWDQRYLGRRNPIAINANFFFLFLDNGQSQLDRATALAIAGTHYYALMKEETLPVTRAREQAMCMNGNRFLFATTRIPAYGQDQVRKPYSEAEPGPARARHIMVFHRGHTFAVDVIGTDGQPYNADQIRIALQEVCTRGATWADQSSSVGHMTTMRREAWADQRQILLGDSHNAGLIEKVETALFCIALEDDEPKTDLAACDLLLHGNSGNRYFDKAVTLVVFANGRAGINIEHCCLDGTVVLEFVDFLIGRAAGGDDRANDSAASQEMSGVEELIFNLSAEQKDTVRNAAEDFRTLSHNAATTTASFEDFGNKRIKELKVSPDAFFQLAMQLAHQRTKGTVGATYESIAVRQYYHGRVEAMRVITPEILTFVSTMEDPAAGLEAKQAGFRAAAAAHIARAKQCQAGEGPEQHLWELLMIHGRRGAQLGIAPDTVTHAGVTSDPAVPFAFFESPGWTITRNDVLSTSSAPSKHVQYFGFGSTSPQCIGVGYVMRDEAINAFLCTPASQVAERDLFAFQLHAALRELEALLRD